MQYSKKEDFKPGFPLQVGKNQLRLYDCNHACGYGEKIWIFCWMSSLGHFEDDGESEFRRRSRKKNLVGW